MSIDFLLEPFQFSFMTRALLGTSLVAVLSALIGTFVVLKGLAFIGDAIAHTAFSGLALALMLGFNLYLGAMVFAMFTAVGVTYLTRTAKVRNDTALAILFTGAFALGVILMSTMPNFAGDLSALLLGSVLAIRLQEVYWILGAVVLIAAIVYFTFDYLVFVSFDPVGAEAAGLPVTKIQMLLMTMIALSIVVSIQAVGVILVVALLITPAATASLFTRRLTTMMLLAAVFGLLATWSGLLLAYYLSAPPGATIVLVATLEFGIGLALSRVRSSVWQLRHSARKGELS